MRFKGILNAFLSYVYIAFVGISSAVLFPIACLILIISFFFDRRRILLNQFTSFWASLYTWCVPSWSVRIFNRQKMNQAKNYIIVSNHQSQLDILVVYRLFFPFRWISKAAVFNLPFIGWNMFLNGYIRLKRKDKDSIHQMMATCERLLKQNISIMIFPEGTRSTTGLVKPFKPGAFVLAKKTKTPIMPLVINNTKDALPKYSMRIRGEISMTVTVLDEIPYTAFKDMEIDQIAAMVREKICSHVKEHQHV